jgi:anti-sigma factor RsiW
MSEKKEFSDQELTRYCLGVLEEPLLSQLEEALFTDPEIEERIEGLEEVLAADYLSGDLSEEDRKNFAVQLKMERRLQERVQSLQLLREAVHLRSRNAKADDRRPGWLSWLFRPQLGYGIAAAVLVLISWLTYSIQDLRKQVLTAQSDAAAQEAQNAALREQLQSLSGAPPVEVSISPGIRMGESSQRRVALPAAARELKLSLESRTKAVRYRAILSNSNGQEVWSGVSDASIFSIPATTLRPGDYLLTLEVADSAGRFARAETYSFALDRP